MIFDKVENAHRYSGVSVALEVALVAAAEMRADIECGRHEYAHGVFANVMEVAAKEVSEAVFETHKRYLDLQLVLKGSETVIVATPSRLLKKEEYSAEKDIAFYAGEGSSIAVRAGEFYVVYPWDAHAPSLKAFDGIIKKAVFKIPFDTNCK